MSKTPEKHSSSPRETRNGEKRKREEQESQSESVGSNSELQTKMDALYSLRGVMPIKLFQQLTQARFRMYPYTDFESWESDGLWHELRSSLYPQDEFPPSVSEIKQSVSRFLQAYIQDEALRSFDRDLRNEMLKVFSPLDKSLGALGTSHIGSDLGPLLKLEYEVKDSFLVLESNSGLHNSRGEFESVISGGHFPLQGIVPRSRSRADAVLALTKFMKKFKFGRQQFVILESLFITEETHGDVFLSLESEREKHEFLMRRLEGFSFMHNMNNDQTNKASSSKKGKRSKYIG